MKVAIGYSEGNFTKKVAIAFPNDLFERIRAKAVAEGISFGAAVVAVCRAGLKD